MQVIADLHGGDPEDVAAKAEFQEIRDRVNLDVSVYRSRVRYGSLIPSYCSGNLARHVLTRSCGRSTNAESYWLCLPRRLPNW